MVRAPTPCAYRGRKPHPTTEYRRAAATNAARGLMTAAVMKTDRRFLCPFSGSRPHYSVNMLVVEIFIDLW